MRPVIPSGERPAAAPRAEAPAAPSVESSAAAAAPMPAPMLPEGATYTPESTQPPSEAWQSPSPAPFAGVPGPDAGYDDVMQAAYAAYRENNLPIARELFKRAAAILPEEAEPHAALGRIYAREGDFNYSSRKEAFEAALYEFEKALALGGDQADVYNDMGFVLLQSGRVEDARAAFARAAQLGGRAVHWYNLGQALYRLKDAGGAAQAFLKALELDPAMKEASFFMGRISAAQGSWQDARAYWAQAVDGFGPDSDMGKIALSGLQQARERLGEVAPEPTDDSLRQKLDRVR
jgi:Flp pilus assembly protein TadD